MTIDPQPPQSNAVQMLPEGRFSGREAFQQLVRDALATAAREGWREIILSDADFHDWPLGRRGKSGCGPRWYAIAPTGRGVESPRCSCRPER